MHEEVVVVGSGYGGAIMAARLARAGRSVAVLERGSERHPGAFPDRFTEAGRHVQVHTAHGRLGPPNALFDFRVARGQSVLVGCGLGGTSLINANVALRAGADVFDDERWPEALRGDGRHQLDRYYELAELMLGSRRYPEQTPPTPKMQALGEGAIALGSALERPPLNVTFSSGLNAVGLHQEACTLCGDCCSGCNVGAKNTVLANYLPDAHANGARIFTEVAVERLRRDGDRWLVDVQLVTGGRSRFDAPPLVVAADVVVLAAGTLGSTEILLRSREAGLPLSDRVGERFNGNGDVLGFAHDTDTDVDAVGWGAKRNGHPIGPTIAGRIALWDASSDDEVTVEEGSIPGVLAPIVGPAVALANLARRDLGPVARVRAAARSARNATRRTLTYLVMSTDDGDGRLRLGRHGLRVDWLDVGRAPVIASDNAQLRRAAEAIGGEYLA
ncbi:MAG TPA: GMC family oxidoreductase N-terminal domain-containing protein, partial [Acidimicrobiales bacterium]